MAEAVDRPLAFKVRAPLGYFLADVMTAAKRVAPGMVRGGQSRGGGYYDVIAQNLEGAKRLREAGKLEIGGREVDLVPQDNKVKRVTVLRYPIDFPDTELEAALSGYGKVLKLRREMMSGDHADCESGNRLVLMELHGALPNFLTVKGFRIECFYPGMERMCAKCEGVDHLAKNCPAVKCRSCGKLTIGPCGCGNRQEMARFSRSTGHPAWGTDARGSAPVNWWLDDAGYPKLNTGKSGEQVNEENGMEAGTVEKEVVVAREQEGSTEAVDVAPLTQGPVEVAEKEIDVVPETADTGDEEEDQGVDGSSAADDTSTTVMTTPESTLSDPESDSLSDTTLIEVAPAEQESGNEADQEAGTPKRATRSATVSRSTRRAVARRKL